MGQVCCTEKLSGKSFPTIGMVKWGCVDPRIQRPSSASGTFLRVITCNDIYKLDNYPRVAAAIKEFKASSEQLDAVVVSCLPGDFLSPCTLTSLDGGVAMLRALNEVSIDYVMFGNHEFDLETGDLQKRIKEYKGTWLNSNVVSPKFVDKDGQLLKRYEIINVGNRKVALAALLLDDTAQFRPAEPRPQIAPPNEAAVTTWGNIVTAEGVVDAYLPMVHLNIKEDRSLAAHIAKHADLATKTPVILSAHDHEVYIEEAGKSLVFKVGQDAENIGVVDLYWTAEGKLKKQVHMLPSDNFESEPIVQKFVDEENEKLTKLIACTICRVPDLGKDLSTAGVRFHEEPMVSWLLSVVKRAMPGVDIMLLQGGNIRGNTAEYLPGPFTYGDLMKEFAFPTEIAILKLPGHVIQASINASRSAGPDSRGKPFFLHCDLDANLCSSEDAFDRNKKIWELKTINGVAFDTNKTYTVATYQFLLDGMGEIEPLTAYCKDNALTPPLESCLPIKHYFLQTCMREEWLELLVGNQTQEGATYSESIKDMFRKFDQDGNGKLDHAEVLNVVTQSRESLGPDVVKFLIQSCDRDLDGMVSEGSIMALITQK